MEILSGYGQIVTQEGPVAATIGNFDGVHLGHQMLLAEARAEATRRQIPAAVVTFDPHPLRILAPERAPRMILTRRQKIEILASFGIDRIVFIPFTPEIAEVRAEEFVKRFLTEQLHVAVLVVGQDFRFGRQRSGDVALLEKLASECRFDLRPMPPLLVDGERVSASHVRDAIAQGNVARAAELMGRAFVLIGKVVHGHGRGKTMKVPTANIEPENELLPADGVYVSETLVELEWHPSVTNIGSRPTFENAGFAIESHLPGFDRALDNATLRVRFHERIRGEMKFPSTDALRTRIAEDIRTMDAWFAARARRRAQP